MCKTLAFVLAVLLTQAAGQAPDPDPDSGRARVPSVTFDLNWPDGSPSHYAIVVESTGRGSYRSDHTANISEGSARPILQPYMLKFTVSEATRERIFDLVRQLDFLKGNFDSGKKVAFTGNKTLIWQDGDRRNQTTFNWAQDARVQELTQIFQGMAATVEFGYRLDSLYRHEKLGLDAELKSLEGRVGQLRELQVVEPILSAIANDWSVLNIARHRARRLLAKIPASGPQNSGR